MITVVVKTELEIEWQGSRLSSCMTRCWWKGMRTGFFSRLSRYTGWYLRTTWATNVCSTSGERRTRRRNKAGLSSQDLKIRLKKLWAELTQDEIEKLISSVSFEGKDNSISAVVFKRIVVQCAKKKKAGTREVLLETVALLMDHNILRGYYQKEPASGKTPPRAWL